MTIVRVWQVGVGLVLASVLACAAAGAALAQENPAAADQTTATPLAPSEEPQAPKEVSVEPIARDDEIRARLQRILDATGWFTKPRVEVDEGVVFLYGTAAEGEYRSWAGKLANSTQDVVAVVNKMEVARPAIWDLSPAVEGLAELWTATLHFLPFAIFGLMILAATVVAARGTRRASLRLFARRVEVPLLRDVIARVCALLVLLVGIYIVLRVSGLSRLALTVVGGTGLLGLIIGIAFQDIAENFLASILLSVQRPFRNGDLVQIGDVCGIVERLNVRSTVIMIPDGNHAQIPNATVYKSVIRNFTSNPNRRDDFIVGIGYDASITLAQNIALQVLSEHPAVLGDPEPWVLVEALGAATVELHIYFWLDGAKHSPPKVRSSIIRLIKRAFDDAGISMPHSAREVLFPRGVPVHIVDGDGRGRNGKKPATPDKLQTGAARPPREPVVTRAEGGLQSDADQISEQMRKAPSPEPGADLLQDSAPSAPQRATPH